MKQQTAAIYARVSTDDQSCEMQLTELRGYAERSGWKVREYVETASGKAGSKRPELVRMLEDARLRKFNLVICWKLDRFGRSLKDIIENIQKLDNANVRFIALTQNIDTDQRSPMGKFLIHIIGAFAELERSLIVERVRAGIAQHKRNVSMNRVGADIHTKSGKDLPTGRPRRVFRRDLAREMRENGASWSTIEKALKVPAATIRRALSKT